MVRISRILRDYSEAGGVNTLVPLWGFVNEHTFLTKAGHVGVVYSLRGVDVDGLTQAQRRALTHRMEAALRQLDERCRVYQYLVKRTVDPFVAPLCAEPVAQEALNRRTAYLNDRRPELYQLTQYVVLLLETTQGQVSTRLQGVWREPREAFRRWLSTHHSLKLLEAELDDAIDRLSHQAESFESQLADFGLARLARGEAFQFFRQLVNYDLPVLSAATPSTPEAYLDYFVADSPVDCHRDHLMVGSQQVKVLSMKEPPGQTFAHILGDLLAVRGEFIACLEWQRAGQDRMRREIQSRRRHFFNKRVSLVNYVSPEAAKGEEMLVDESATATVKQLGDALTEMEVNGHVFGRCSLTVVLHDEDRRALDQQAAHAMKVLAAHDGAFFDETYNLLNAWVSIVPGNGARNLRRLALLETHAADLSFLFGVDQGQGGSPLLSAPLATFETPHQTPFAYHLHVQDVGPHARPRRDRQRQELPAELHRHERSTVRSVHNHPGPGSRIPKARGAPSRRLRGAGPATARRQHQPVLPGANSRTPALPPWVRPRPPRGRRRLSLERTRGSRGLRSGRKPVRARPKSAQALHAREPACHGA